YPNPANENINVNLFANNSNKASIEIFSISGTKVFSQNYSNLNNGENNININVKQLPAGMYIITLKYDDKTEAHKISIN
ncbi:MAG: T9SS type A sorting domain-containing protein, partial [Bacteroidales bacterium]|nr:T9SS type A sorting domain-containing protein [Bacteroidales bacterium]